MPAALGSIRTLTRKDKVTIGGYEVPKGTDVGVNYYSLFRNNIDNPDVFDPDRYACMYVCMHVCIYSFGTILIILMCLIRIGMHVWIYVVYVCMYVCIL